MRRRFVALAHPEDLDKGWMRWALGIGQQVRMPCYMTSNAVDDMPLVHVQIERPMYEIPVSHLPCQLIDAESNKGPDCLDSHGSIMNFLSNKDV